MKNQRKPSKLKKIKRARQLLKRGKLNKAEIAAQLRLKESEI